MMWSGPCLGGPMNAKDGASRYSQGFLLIERETNRVWIYDYIPYGRSPTGGAFQVRIQTGECLVSNPGAVKNRYRAADEVEFDVRVVNEMYGFAYPSECLGEFVPSPWEAAFDTAVYAGRYELAMNEDDMVLATRNWMKVWSDATDPRRVYFDSFTGWQGHGVPKQWSFIDNSVTVITNDYEWHQQIVVRPLWHDEPEVDSAIVSISRGESKRQWMMLR